MHLQIQKLFERNEEITANVQAENSRKAHQMDES